MSPPLLVADSGPLIALARIDLLALPARLYSQVMVTQTVWTEVMRGPHRVERETLGAARERGHFALIDDPSPLPATIVAMRLDLGEQTALAAAVERRAAVMIDEREGRTCAARLQLQVIGTLGVLVRAKQLDLTGPVRPLVERLIDSGYHLAPGLVEMALAKLNE